MSSSQSYQTTSSSDASELTPLVSSGLQQQQDNTNNGNYYFLANTRRESFQGSVNRGQGPDEGAVVEKLPYGATEEEFASRPVGGLTRGPSATARNKQGFFSKLFTGQNPYQQPSTSQPMTPNNMTIGTSFMKKRQAAIKIEPKVFFANERTFLAWLHSSVLLAGASIAVVSISGDNFLNQLYGIILLPIAITFMLYSMHQYGKRAQMIRRRAPGPYEDIVGPAVLAVVLMLSILAQFCIKVYQITH